MKFQSKIDFQAHYLPRTYYDFLEEKGLYCPDGFPTPEWSEETQQESMKELGISYALLSLSSPSLYTGNKFKSRELARRVNIQGAEIVSRAPGNLGFLAALPLPHVDSSIFEARYCLDELHADGVGLMTNYGGVYLGDHRLDELMAELDGRGALAVMHPTQPAVMVPDVNEEIPVPAFEYPLPRLPEIGDQQNAAKRHRDLHRAAGRRNHEYALRSDRAGNERAECRL